MLIWLIYFVFSQKSPQVLVIGIMLSCVGYTLQLIASVVPKMHILMPEPQALSQQPPSMTALFFQNFVISLTEIIA
jgi:hypothetical protein